MYGVFGYAHHKEKSDEAIKNPFRQMNEKKAKTSNWIKQMAFDWKTIQKMEDKAAWARAFHLTRLCFSSLLPI